MLSDCVCKSKCLTPYLRLRFPRDRFGDRLLDERGDRREERGVAAFPVAVKAQVRSGGRGKHGGVRQVKTAGECMTT
jgi:hypothetical protein